MHCSTFIYLLISEITPITNSSGLSQVHARYIYMIVKRILTQMYLSFKFCSCTPFQGPVECIPYMNYSFYYSYTSNYESMRSEVIDLISKENCNTSSAIQYICNSIFPVCEVDSGEPLVICNDDCLAVTSQASCEIFMEQSSSFPVNCSNSLQFIEEHYQNISSHSLSQCIMLSGNLLYLIYSHTYFDVTMMYVYSLNHHM